MTEERLNCPNCGAPITGDRCEYCGTQFIDTTVTIGKPFYLKVMQGDSIIIDKVFVESMNAYVDPVDTMDLYANNEVYVTVCSTPRRRYTINYISVSGR